MITRDELINSGKNISKISKALIKNDSVFNPSFVYLESINETYENFVVILEEFFNAGEDKTSLDVIHKKLIRNEIKAWEIYIPYIKNRINKSYKHRLLHYKNYFKKESEYNRIYKDIKKIRSELNDKNSKLDLNETLEKMRLIGSLFDEIEKQKIINDWQLFWIAIGAIGAFGVIIIGLVK